MLTVITPELGCGPKGPAPEVAGQVFIVTRGRENLKLGLVDVLLFERDDLRKSLVARTALRQSHLAELNTGAEQALRDAQELVRKSRSADAELSLAWEAVRADAEHVSEGHPASKRYSAAAALSAKLAADRERIRERANRLQDSLTIYESAAFLRDSLPPPVRSTKTDANGEFTLSLEGVMAAIILAQASRETPRGREEYLWILMIGRAPDAAEKLLLSNHNLVQMNSVLSYLETATADRH